MNFLLRGGLPSRVSLYLITKQNKTLGSIVATAFNLFLFLVLSNQQSDKYLLRKSFKMEASGKVRLSNSIYLYILSL